MKSSLTHGLVAMEEMLRAAAAALPVVAPAGVAGVALRAGHHAHDAWELFMPRGAHFHFEVAGRAAVRVPPGSLLLVPPGCIHMGVDKVRQARTLRILVLTLPGREITHGCASFGGVTERYGQVVLTDAGDAAWRASLGAAPAAVLAQAAAGLAAGGWSATRGAAQVRLVIGAFAEAAAGMTEPQPAHRGERRVQQAGRILRERFYDPALSLAAVAAEVGLSPTHLTTRFKAVTGHPFWKTLVGIRLERARTLLQDGQYSVKEVAALTGWSNQLYFSSAFRRHFGFPPSATKARPAPESRG